MTFTQTARLLGLGLGSSLGAMLLAQPALSHGAHIDYSIAPSIAIQAQFDSGEPMAQAQVAVFAPGSPETPWQTGITDGAGNFSFSPDASQAGDWEVQVRQAGHGSMITIPVTSTGGVASTTSNELDPAQKLLMTGLGLWGFLGTGLYFSNRSRGQTNASTSAHPGSPDNLGAKGEKSAVDPPVPV